MVIATLLLFHRLGLLAIPFGAGGPLEVTSPGPSLLLLPPQLPLQSSDYRPPPVGGSLSFFCHQWESVSDAWAVQTVSFGYQLGVFSCPTQVFKETPLPQNPVKRAALLEDVQLLLEKAAVVEVPPLVQGLGYYSILFLVQKVDTADLRPLLDLKGVNRHILYRHFKMVTLQSILQLVHQGWLPRLHRPDGRLPACSHSCGGSVVSALCCQLATLPVPGDSFWPFLGAKGFSEALGPPGGYSPFSRYSSLFLP